jgi:hypothetical protein
LKTPARSLAGIAVKLRLARAISLAHSGPDVEDDRDFDWRDRPALSALRDAERLSGGVA